MKNKKLIKSFFIVLFVFLVLLIFYIYNLPYKIDKNFEKLDLTGYNKLMIVAHPDDEVLWGGAHLIDDDYLVVCVTCGNSRRRVREFQKVMKLTGDKYIMLGYPDKTNGERDNWDSVRDDITKDLQKIVDLKEWDLIVTHNRNGEYGHIHHKMTHKIVTSVAPHENLYFFGRYYTKKKIVDAEDELPRIDADDLDYKVNVLIEVYKSQKFIKDAFDQMFPYENWTHYEEGD